MVFRVLTLVSMVLIFVACGGGSTPEGAPYVKADSMGDGSAVSISSGLQFTFNKDIDENKNDAANIALYAEGNTTQISGTVTVSGETVTFTPGIILEYSSNYRIVVSGIVDLTNTKMKSAYTRTFTTTDFIQSVDPADGESNISVFADISLTFGDTQASNPTITVSNLTFSISSTDNKTFTLTPNGGTAYDSFYSGMDAATTFTVTVSAATDTNGKTLASPFTASFTTVPPDVTAPVVTASYPSSGASDIPSDINITLQFDEDIITPTTSDITLTDENAVVIPYTLSYDAATRILTMLPTAVLDYATGYTVSISNIRDIFGNILTSSIGFTTSTILKATTPDDGDIDVEVDSVLTALFEGKIDATGATFSLKDAASVPVTGTTLFGLTSASFTPAADLDFSTTYTATISGVKDLSGNTLADQTWSFTTKADDINPQFVSRSPANLATGVATGTTVSATFDEDITGTIKFIVQNSDGNSIAGNITVSGPTVTFTPTLSLDSSESYSVFVSGVTDLSGNKAQTLIWSFETL